MDEYISREAVLGLIAARKRYLDDARGNSSLTELSEIDGYEKALDVLKEDLQEINAADVQPVKHGEWVSEMVRKPDWKGVEHDYFQPNSCSVCHTGLAVRSNFCPNCGARMDGDPDA